MSTPDSESNLVIMNAEASRLGQYSVNAVSRNDRIKAAGLAKVAASQTPLGNTAFKVTKSFAPLVSSGWREVESRIKVAAYGPLIVRGWASKA